MWLNKHKRLIIVIIIAVAITTVAIILLVAHNNQPTEEAPAAEPATLDEIGDITRKIQNTIDREGYQAGVKQWDEEMLNTEDSATLATYYDARAAQLYSYYTEHPSDGLKIQILADAHTAELTNPTADTAMSIYVYENYLGDSEIAQKYRTIAFGRDPNLKSTTEAGQG